MKIAGIGDVIQFEYKGYKCRGVVYNVLENAVAVDVSQNAVYVKEGIDRTIVNHKKYQVVTGGKVAVDTDKLRGIKTISNYSKKQKQEDKHLSEQKFERKELTKVKYLHYRNVENKTDGAICRMFGIPTGSWTKIKAGLMDGTYLNAAKEKATVAPKTINSEVNAPTVPTIPLPEHDRKVAELMREIEQLKNKNVQLASKTQDANTMHINLIADLEKDIAQLKQQLEIETAAKVKFELIANDNAMEVERLQREYTTYLQSQQVKDSEKEDAHPSYYEQLANEYAAAHEEKECQNCEQLRKSYEKQLKWYMTYEKTLHERTICLIDQVISLSEAE